MNYQQIYMKKTDKYKKEQINHTGIHKYSHENNRSQFINWICMKFDFVSIKTHWKIFSELHTKLLGGDEKSKTQTISLFSHGLHDHSLHFLQDQKERSRSHSGKRGWT